MQISRHWRLNPQRYRLQGVRLEDGSVSLQTRPTSVNQITLDNEVTTSVEQAAAVTAVRQS
ncbi:MAG: hypothetical protein ACOYL5_00180 [Phototrophicaceae bacterium]|jgi:hypothetical protein